MAALKISRKAARTGFSSDLRQWAHKGMGADFGTIGRIVTWGRFKLRTQRGMRETPSPLSTRVITVAMKFGSLTTRGEKPARRQHAITSSNRPGAPLR